MSITVLASKNYQLQGTIGTIPIYMNIDDYSDTEPNGEDNVLASYYYQSSLKEIILMGRLHNHIYKLSIGDGTDNILESFILTKQGNNFIGKWVNSSGKTLPVNLKPIEIEKINNPYASLDVVKMLKSNNTYDYVRSSFIKLKRDSVSQMNDKSIIWFSEAHCNSPFFRLGNGFNKAQLDAVNPVLDEIHIQKILDQLSCSSRWGYAYNEGDRIDYTITLGYLSDDLIGFDIFASWDCGGAHPDFGGTGYLLDLKNGSQYDLKEVYNLDATTIYSLVNSEQHFQKPVDADDYCDFTNLEFWEYTEWSISEKGVSFTPYFYRAARACQEPFLVPFEKLRPYLKSSFPYKL